MATLAVLAVLAGGSGFMVRQLCEKAGVGHSGGVTVCMSGIISGTKTTHGH